MVTGKLKNRLLLLVQEKERQAGRRIKASEIAAESGVAPTVIGRWMRNEVDRLDAPIIEKLCAYFQCDVGDLLYLDYGEAREE